MVLVTRMPRRAGVERHTSLALRRGQRQTQMPQIAQMTQRTAGKSLLLYGGFALLLACASAPPPEAALAAVTAEGASVPLDSITAEFEVAGLDPSRMQGW